MIKSKQLNYSSYHINDKYIKQKVKGSFPFNHIIGRYIFNERDNLYRYDTHEKRYE